MSRRTPNDAMIEDIHARVRLLDRGSPFISMVEEAMTAVHVPYERRNDMKGYSDFYAHEHDKMLRQIQRILAPLMNKRLVVSGQLGLMRDGTWIEHMADYAPYGVTGILSRIDGFVLEKSDNYGLTTKGTQDFQYCLMMTGPDLKVSSDEPKLNLRSYDLSAGVLVPIRGLGSGWWQQIVRIVEQTVHWHGSVEHSHYCDSGPHHIHDRFWRVPPDPARFDGPSQRYPAVD